MFLTGPGVVRDALGEEIDAAALGGPRVHERNGVCHLVEARRGRRRCAGAGAALLSAGRGRRGSAARRGARAGASRSRSRSSRPSHAARTTSASRCAAIVDAGSLFELCPRWARNVVTALARIDGRPVAIVANQPRYLGGVLDAEASEKAARFVSFCDSFGLPLIAVVDTPGFMPGSKPGAGGRDPPRRFAGASVRVGAGAEADRGPAQVLWRRVHHDELPRPRAPIWCSRGPTRSSGS